MKRKSSGGIVFSTNPDFNFNNGNEPEPETLPVEKQKLRLRTESKGRGGKTVTIIGGFTGSVNDMATLAKDLKLHCGSGGAVKEGEIIIQGDNREKIKTYLSGKGYNIK